MYKGKSFLASVSKQRSQTSQQIANIIYENRPVNRCSSQHRMMEFSLRFASLLVCYLHLDLNRRYFQRVNQNNEKTSIRFFMKDYLFFNLTPTITNLKFKLLLLFLYYSILQSVLLKSVKLRESESILRQYL